MELASALVSLDMKNDLEPLLEPYRADASDKVHAMWLYLVDSNLPRLRGEDEQDSRSSVDEYLSQQYVLMGKRGFQKGALLMLDYIDQLPNSQDVIVCALHARSLWHGDVVFALRFMRKLKRALSKDTSFTIVESRADSVAGSPHFSVYWLTQNLRGTFRGRVFSGEAEEHFVATIPGRWSGRTAPDRFAKDGLVSTFSTDKHIIYRDTELCRSYLSQCSPPSQYGFFKDPEGTVESPCRWSPQFDPRLLSVPFSSVSRIPLFGVMTADEFRQLSGVEPGVSIPKFLFAQNEAFSGQFHRLILCADDVKAALMTGVELSLPLTQLLCRETGIPRGMVHGLVDRVLQAMEAQDELEVALMPKRAFERIEMELVTWRGTMAVGWLQDGNESMLDTEPAVVASFDSAVEHVWSKLSDRWKNQQQVRQTLEKWLGSGFRETQTIDDEPGDSWSPYLQF